MTGPVPGDYSWSLLVQEQQAQADDIKDLRFNYGAMVRRLHDLEQQVATLQAAWQAHVAGEEGQEDDSE